MSSDDMKTAAFLAINMIFRYMKEGRAVPGQVTYYIVNALLFTFNIRCTYPPTGQNVDVTRLCGIIVLIEMIK